MKLLAIATRTNHFFATRGIICQTLATSSDTNQILEAIQRGVDVTSLISVVVFAMGSYEASINYSLLYSTVRAVLCCAVQEGVIQR